MVQVSKKNPSLPPVTEIQQVGPESEDTVGTSGCGRCKRAPCQIGALNGCLCGMVVNVDESNAAMKCQQPGCKTRWVSSTQLEYNVTHMVYSITFSV
jgi:hypothetical protein